MNRYNCGLSDIERTAISFMLELIRLRDNYLEYYSEFYFYYSDIVTFINYVSTL